MSKPKLKQIRVSLRLSKESYAALSALARQHERSRTKLVELMVLGKIKLGEGK